MKEFNKYDFIIKVCSLVDNAPDYTDIEIIN